MNKGHMYKKFSNVTQKNQNFCNQKSKALGIFRNFKAIQDT